MYNQVIPTMNDEEYYKNDDEIEIFLEKMNIKEVVIMKIKKIIICKFINISVITGVGNSLL